MDTETTKTPVTPTEPEVWDEPELDDGLVPVRVPPDVARILGAKQCVLIAADVDKGLPIGWVGLANGALGLTGLDGQALLLLALDKMRETMIANAVVSTMAQLKRQEAQQMEAARIREAIKL